VKQPQKRTENASNDRAWRIFAEVRMIEASLLLVELVLFGLVLLAAKRPQTLQPTRDLGLFSYRESLEATPKTGPVKDKGFPRA